MYQRSAGSSPLRLQQKPHWLSYPFGLLETQSSMTGPGEKEPGPSVTDPRKESKEHTSSSPKTAQTATGVDAALELLRETGGLSQPLDPERNKRLLRRIDAHIMPLICIVYFLQYIDKTAVSYASVTGLPQSIGLIGNQFNWVASIFFFGQLVWEFPTIRLMQMFPLAKYVSVNVTLWGTVLACMAARKNYAGLLACRFFLGVLEAAIVPAWVLFTSQWYTKEEQAFRVGIWFSVCGAAQMFGGFFAYGVSIHVGADLTAAIKGWQVIFLFLGLLTALIGITFWFVMPDSPAVAGFLDKDETGLHLERIRGNEQGIGSQTFKWAHVREALTDTMTWLYAFWIFAANIPNSIVTSFGNILVKGMGYGSEDSLLLVTPLGAWEIVALIGLTYGSTKKVTVATIGTIAYTVGNIISPQTFQARDAPRYLPAEISICIIYFLITVDLFVIRWVLDRRNKKRDQEKAALGDTYTAEENHEFLDLTDLQNKEFRYEL
ncbi:putative Major facilitator superfamily domain-containing protein [Seiridium unicorne]|uniref:Major facilitator superfamily domain-containing protein n=1 Tax=Seiridium unicorne TaxID=138068 RepID=A0ABR2VFG4_9PEZI